MKINILNTAIIEPQRTIMNKQKRKLNLHNTKFIYAIFDNETKEYISGNQGVGNKAKARIYYRRCDAMRAYLFHSIHWNYIYDLDYITKEGKVWHEIGGIPKKSLMLFGKTVGETIEYEYQTRFEIHKFKFERV
jgi:hypothetical protein